MKGIYKITISALESMVKELDSEVPRPELTSRGWRHKEIFRNDILASFLKASRLVSLLNASLELLDKGYVQEVYILGRAVDETVEEVFFLALKEETYADRQRQLLAEFYTEETEDPLDPTSSAKRDRVSRKRITAAISNIKISSGDPHTRNKTANAIHQLFSGFVHGAYVHLMEIFSPMPLEFPMHGVSHTPYLKVCEENFANHIYRSIIACVLVAARLKQADIRDRLIDLKNDFGKITGVVA